MVGEVWHKYGQFFGTKLIAVYCADTEWMYTDERPGIRSGVEFDSSNVFVDSVGFLADGR